MPIRRFRAFLAISALACIAATSVPARADPTAAAISGAQSLVGEGRKLREAGDVKGARDRFQSAYLLVPTPIIGLDLGKAREALGELIEARVVLLECAALPPIPKESAESTGARADALRIAKDLDARIPTLLVTIEGATPDAKTVVTIDSIEVPEAELGTPRPLNPGKHVVVARMGDRQQRVEVQLAEKDAKKETLVFPVIVAPPDPPKGPTVKGPAGPLDGDAPQTTTRFSPLTYVGFGVAGAGLVVGTITGIVALNKAHTFAAKCEGYNFQCPPQIRDDYDSSRRYGNVSTVAFIVGGAGLALGVYGLFTRQTVTSASPAQPVALSVGPGSIALHGAF